MKCCRETMKMGVPARHRESARSGEAGGPPGNPAEGVIRRRSRHPRTLGRTAISVVVAGDS
jgi:N-methylhydantoinase B/oxoprolinase/acetone carboxylase alpha subunit